VTGGFRSDRETGVSGFAAVMLAGQLNYQVALAAGLLIGSGEVESAYRYVLQQRLKRQGQCSSGKEVKITCSASRMFTKE